MRATSRQKIVKVRLTNAYIVAARMKYFQGVIVDDCSSMRKRTRRDNGKEFDARIMCFENRETAATLPRDIA